MTRQENQALIIGGGVIGVCCMYYLVQRGWDVVLIEKDQIGAGCSYGNAGLLVPGHSIPLARPGVIAQGLRWLFNDESPFHIEFRLSPALISWLIKFRRASSNNHMRRSLPVLRDLIIASMELYRQFLSMSEFDFGYLQNGVLGVYLTKDGLAEGIEEARLLQEVNVGAEVLDVDATLALEPALRPDVVGSVYYTDDAQILPDVFVQKLKCVAENMGARIHVLTEVVGFNVKNRQITSVQTSQGTFYPGLIVLAAGSWSPILGQALDLKLPIQPAKGFSVTCQLPVGSPRLPLLLSESRVAVTPMGNKLRFAGILELVGFDSRINERRVRGMMRSVDHYLALQDRPAVIETWSGFRPCTPDGLPIIARSKQIDNLILATGHGMLGMTLGPITGLLVSQLAARECTMIDFNPFALERFSVF